MIQRPLKQKLELLSERAALDELARALRRFADTTGMEGRAAMQLRLVLEEVLTNTIDYGNCAGTRIDIALNAECEGIRVEYRDCGIAFDPLREAPDDGVDLPVERRRVGGLGWTLIRNLCNPLSYAREGDSNVIRLTIAPDDL